MCKGKIRDEKQEVYKDKEERNETERLSYRLILKLGKNKKGNIKKKKKNRREQKKKKRKNLGVCRCFSVLECGWGGVAWIV